MTDNSQPKPTVNYGELSVRVNGRRDDVNIVADANVLTAEQKIDRDLLFRVARHLPVRGTDVFIELYDAAGNDVLRASAFSAADLKTWAVSAHFGNQTDKFDEPMSETKRAGKSGKASGEIDTGPAVLKLATAVLKKYGIPIVQIAAESGPRVSKTATQIATFEDAISKAEALKTGNPATDGVVDALIATLRTQVADLTARQEKGQKLAASRKSAAQPAASTVAVAATPVGRVTDQKNPTKKGK